VNPPAPYLWQAATWNGNTLLASTELDRLVGMTAGERADEDKIGRGIRAVTDAYRNRGHLDVAVQSQPVFDDTRRQVACAIRIVEGDEFRMGKLDVAGLDPAVAERVKGLWQLAEGDVFDASYLSRFVPDARARLREALAPFKSVEVQTRRDSRALTVDVVVTFKAAAQAAAGPGPWFRDPAGSPP
jgi:outer membrane protein assembly factor BamA